MKIEYTIALNYKELDEHPLLNSEEFCLSMEQMSNHLKTRGWLVTNKKTDTGSKMECELGQEAFDGLVSQELSKKMNSFSGIVLYNLYKLFGERFKEQFITDNKSIIKKTVHDKITKSVETELIFFSRIKGFSIMKGSEPLKDMIIQENVKSKKNRM